jgi:ATP-dependent DNA helicase RecG
VRFDTELRYLKGVGPARGAKLAEASIVTVEDLLYLMPFRYEDRRRFAKIAELLAGGPDTTLDVTVESARLIRTRRRGFTIFRAEVSDDSGRLVVLWYNQPYLERVIVAGRRAVLFGRPVLDRYGRQLVLESPDYELLEGGEAEGVHTGRVVPVYRRTGDFGSRGLRSLLWRALAELTEETLPEVLPPEVVRARRLPPRLVALRQVHFPPPEAKLVEIHERRTPAHRALAFEEIFLLQLALALRRQGVKAEVRARPWSVDEEVRRKVGRVLPFPLTGAQRRVLREIGEDLRGSAPMNRMVQGDVGSGKTIVALLALLLAVENGRQGALMAPTEILAEQHHRSLSRVLEEKGAPCRLGLFTGAIRAGERRKRLQALRSGEIDVAIGTHALFEAGVAFRDLGLVVVDEQHRFGVLQRAALALKGHRPDVLVMTATPIPRSLALTVYGDLDLSVIDEMPPGRTPIKTMIRTERERKQVEEGIRQAVRAGRQAYVVVPLVEETEKGDLKAATAHAEHLRKQVFKDLRVGLLHGRMKGADKEAVMLAFAAGTIDVLVATTVVEVGVDVPNATVMVVEHAERFGLSQLHQLRGRVGRGSAKSYCVLMVGEGGATEDAAERLRVLEGSHDGFVIAERDLDLRGPGAVFGTQQHGLSDLQFLQVALKDPGLLEAARTDAQRYVEADRTQADRILQGLRASWKRRLSLAQVG